jgi:hypothetical protein
MQLSENFLARTVVSTSRWNASCTRGRSFLRRTRSSTGRSVRALAAQETDHFSPPGNFSQTKKMVIDIDCTINYQAINIIHFWGRVPCITNRPVLIAIMLRQLAELLPSMKNKYYRLFLA